MRNYLLLILVSIAFITCKPEVTKKFKSEVRLERWSVKGDSLSYEKDAIQYLESTFYNEKEEVKAVAYYDNNKQLTATEERLFDKETGK